MTTVAQAELNSITDFQKELHIPVNEEEEIASNFYNEFVRTTWYANSLIKFKHNKVSEDQIDYFYPEPCGFLIYSELVQRLPELSVKDDHRADIRIAWTPSIAYNIVDNARLTIGDVEAMNLTNISIEQYYQYCREPGFDNALNKGVGDVPFLTDFSEYLPSYSTVLVHPWFYNDNAKKLPMFDGIGKTVVHSYKFRNQISSLLRMQELVDGEWVNVPVNLSFLNGIPADNCLSAPEFWAKVSYNCPEELEVHRCESKIDIYYRDFITVSSPNPEKMGKKVVVDNMTRLPCRSLWWAAQNVEALEYNYYSNYTNNPYDREKDSWSPIKSFSIFHGTQLKKVDEMDTVHAELIEPRKHYKSQPLHTGHGAFAISLDPLKNNDISLSLGDLKTRFIANLGNTDIFAKRNQSYSDSSYIVHLTLMVQRKITFERNKNPTKDTSEYTVYVDKLEERSE